MSLEHRIQRLMSGRAKGILSSLGRSTLGAIEPIYQFVVNSRNSRYDADPSRIRRLPKPVISVGNLTTGGTGKTPVIRWLAGALRDRGLKVAILARGYKAAPGSLGDEQRMLLAMLSGASSSRKRGRPRPPSQPDDGKAGGDVVAPRDVVIECDPDRYAAGLRALDKNPDIDLFLLDDGFQHRRLHRDLDIVLLHAAEPFGYGHVLPRGLLREPVAGIRRAGIVILTSADAASAESKAVTTAVVRRHQPIVPIFEERHEPTGMRSAAISSGQPCDVPLAALADRSAFCFSGLGSPSGFEWQIRTFARTFAGAHRFPDHHTYTPADLAKLRSLAASARADALVTTEKDWVKLADLPAVGTSAIPIWRLDVEARLDDEVTLLQTILNCTSLIASAGTSGG